MKKLFFVLSISVFSIPLSGQFGINIGYQISDASQWQIVTDQYIANEHFELLRLGATAGIDYNFPTKNKFLKIQPNIQFSKLNSSLIHFESRLPYDFDLFNFSFQCNLNFYLIKFKSKKEKLPSEKNDAFGKHGFWIQLSPSIDHFRAEYRHPEVSEDGSEYVFINSGSVYFTYSIGTRLGVDIECSRLFSLTPFIGFRYFPKVDWKDLTEITTKGQENGTYDFSPIKQFNIGIRIGFDFEQ